MTQSEPAADGWVVHADESGSPDLHRVDPQFPVFVVAFCLSKMSDYARQIVPAVTELKLKHFGHDAVVLHEYDIRKGRESFEFSSDDARREFMEDLDKLMIDAPVRFAASMIDKRTMPEKLAPWLDGYGVCFSARFRPRHRHHSARKRRLARFGVDPNRGRITRQARRRKAARCI